jgi:hypothetical protein
MLMRMIVKVLSEGPLERPVVEMARPVIRPCMMVGLCRMSGARLARQTVFHLIRRYQ